MKQVRRTTNNPASRQTSAVYSSGECYQYLYDQVGNRTALTTTVGTTTYQYDAANRLITAGGVTYTWDNTGNLINDGSAAYLYDRANRLISTTLSGVTTQFNYNGDGARLKQIVNGVVTTYTQDLAAPLPVVLEAKTGVTTTKYLYSLGTRPLAQNGGAWEYLLPDAWGSVRQIVDANGNVTLAESYEPYGSVLTSTGTASSIFGYAGEQADTTGLIYLRARYMNPALGIFLAKDPWSGDVRRPESMNGWSYTEGNPINQTDPSGYTVEFTPFDCFFVSVTPELLSLPPYNYLPAREAVNLCRRLYSNDSSAGLIVQNTAGSGLISCNYEWSKPQDAVQLLQDFVCDKGNAVLVYNWDEPLTHELARTSQIAEVREEFYQQGDIPWTLKKFGDLSSALWATRDLIENGSGELTHILASVNVYVTAKNSRVNFFVYNRMDLASGTHFRGRFGDERSVEALIAKDETLANRPLKEIFDNHPEVMSILKPKNRSETQGSGGGTTHQIFKWSERFIECSDLYPFLFKLRDPWSLGEILDHPDRNFDLDMGPYTGLIPPEVYAELDK